MFGSALSASQDNLDGQSFNDFSSDEDDMTDASDVTAAEGVSIAKRYYTYLHIYMLTIQWIT